MLVNNQIKDIYSSYQSITALIKPANPLIINFPNFRETITIFISSMLSFAPNPSSLSIYLTSIISTQQILSSSLKLLKQDLNNYLTPDFYDSTSFLTFSLPLITLYKELDNEPNPQTIQKIIKDLSTLKKPLEVSNPIKPTQTTTLEALGQVESISYDPTPPTISPRIDFDMNSLKLALKQPNHKILYKQVSSTGSIQISDKAFSSLSSPDPIPQIPKISSFKDFIIFPQKSLITLEGTGENSDTEL